MTFKNRMINLIGQLPVLREYLNFKRNSCYPAGHYYSPVISVENIRKRESEIWHKAEKDGITGIDLQTENQLSLVKSFKKYYHEIPFTSEKQTKNRYYFENPFYSYTDGIMLYCMIRHFRPKRIIEIGSGFSSAVMLDTNELFFKNQIALSFIEPYPARLYSLINENDRKSTKIISSDVQAISLQTFEELGAGDYYL